MNQKQNWRVAIMTGASGGIVHAFRSRRLYRRRHFALCYAAAVSWMKARHVGGA